MKNIVLFLGSFYLTACVFAQSSFDFYISNSGSDSNTGHSIILPKKTIAGASASFPNVVATNGTVKIGFKSGDIFNETLSPAYPLQAGTYFNKNGNKKFAIFNGTNVFDSGWIRTTGTINTFEQKVPLTGFATYGIVNVGQYSIVCVFEIDKIQELFAPVTARKQLQLAASLQGADANPGSFYEPITKAENPKTIYIHTSNSSSPNKNARYRYEVTVRDRAFNSTYQQSNHFERLWIRGYGAGNGMIPAGANSSFNRMIFGPGAGIHHLGLRGASINNSLFLPGPKNTNGFAVVFYDVEGFGRHNKISNSIFLDIKYPIYTHISYGTNFGALELDNVIAFANKEEAESFLQTGNNDSLFLNNVYAKQYKYGYAGTAKFFVIKNSVFIDLARGIIFSYRKLQASVANSFFKTGGTGTVSGIEMGDSTDLVLTNSIVHLKNDNSTAGTSIIGNCVLGAAQKNNRIVATGNIFICDVGPEKNIIAASANANNGNSILKDQWQNNVYVLLRGNKITWRIINKIYTGSRTDVETFEEWKQQSGQDKRGLFFDLRKDPRRLKAIFVDPDNGDYALANTIEGNKIKELMAGMVSPVSCFLKKPTYEEAAKIIMEDAVLSANACRSPCVQNSIRINYQFNESLPSDKKVQLQWNIEDERSVDHYEIQRSFGNSDFINAGSVQASGAANYSFEDKDVQPGIEYRYSLVLVTKLGDKCYSAIRSIKIKDGKSLTIYPNPSSGKIMLLLNGYAGSAKITVTNTIGSIVFSKGFNIIYGIPTIFDLSAQSKGLYWMKIQTDKNTSLQSFILK